MSDQVQRVVLDDIMSGIFPRGSHILVAIVAVVSSARGVKPAPVGVDNDFSVL